MYALRTGWDDRGTLLRVFQNQQTNRTRWRLPFANCCQLIRDWKLENVASSKVISTGPFRMEKEDYL